MTTRILKIKNERINSWLFKITCIYWLVVKLFGWRMFTANRLFPTVPVFERLNQVPAVVHFILFVASLLLIGIVFFRPKDRFVLAALLLIEVCACMLDQNRWQPWEYQCIFTMFIFLVGRNRQASITAAFTFILASTYLYSGCNKLNEGFLQNIWSQMLLRSFFKLAVARQSWLYYFGYLPALFELAAGAALLFLNTRKAAACFLILVHLFILVWLGPIGLNYNKIIWPWNITMILYLYINFISDNGNSLIFNELWVGWNKLVLILWGILPAFGVIGYWDSFLSSSIYSGKSPYMIICISNPEKADNLKPYFSKNDSKLCATGATIYLKPWAMAETVVLPNPELRVFKQIKKKLEKEYAAAGLTCYIFDNRR